MGYEDTRQKIIGSLLGRPNGTMIMPENHQDYALSLLDYVRRVELISASVLIGVAEPDTVPVQPEGSRVVYIAGVGPETTAQFANFIDSNGEPITISNGEMEASLIILMWNQQYWSYEDIPTTVVSKSDQATIYYNLRIRKTYNSISDLEDDVVDPIGNDGLKIRFGETVSVHNESNPSENAIYSYEYGPRWQLQMRLEAVNSRSFDGGRADTQYGGVAVSLDCGNAQG